MKTMSESRMRLHFLSLIMICCVSTSSSFAEKFDYNSYVACRPHQIQALTEFKNEFDTSHCNHSDPFNGVWCDNSTRTITKLQLRACLSGSLKPNSSLFWLPHLRHLELSQNNFSSSSLPSEFGNLKRLEFLSLSNNGLVGQVPSSFNNLSMLSYLDLYTNEFTGSFPLIMNLTKLVVLDLSYNHFSGTLNPNSSLFEFHHLIYLNLAFNNFHSSIPSEFGNFKRLEMLALSSNEFFGQVPLTISNSLTYLYLDLNKLTGSFPLIQNLTKLLVLDLSKNHFSGTLNPNSSLFELHNLRYLGLGVNKFSSSLPSEFGNLSRLEMLALSSNEFFGQVPPTISNLTSLTGLYLDQNKLTGPIPQCLSNLTVVNLRKNNLEGSIPDEFNACTLLRTLNVGYNRLTGKLPRSLVNCSSLQFLSIENNKIEDTFPFWLKALPNLQILTLRSNKFFGPISPPDDGSLGFPELRIFEISDNSFTGSLPPSYFENWKASSLIMNEDGGVYMGYIKNVYGKVSYSYLDIIDLRYKGLTMEQAYVLTSYATIDFSGNKLEGQIPESIGLLKALIALNLSNNAFTGHIPLSFSNLTELESLDLSSNQLSGTIPNGLGSLSFLEYINVSHNKLKGEIPQGTQITGQPKSSFEGNARLCGLPLQVTCFGTKAPPTQQPKEEDEKEEEEEEVLNWKGVAIGYGPGVFLGLAIAQVIVSFKQEWLTKIIGPIKRRNR